MCLVKRICGRRHAHTKRTQALHLLSAAYARLGLDSRKVHNDDPLPFCRARLSTVTDMVESSDSAAGIRALALYKSGHQMKPGS